MAQLKLVWQSKLVLLLVLPAVAASVVLETHWWAEQMAPVAIWTIGLSLVLGLVALETHSSTLGGAAAGAAVMASLMFSTVIVPYLPWQTALPPVLMVLLLTSVATRVGRGRKEELGIAERKEGRAASQVAANLGFAALVTGPLVQSWLSEANWLPKATLTPMPGFALGLAALAEAAADTLSSEIGQVLGGRPRMITTLRYADPGTDGAVSPAGTLAGVASAGLVAVAGSVAMHGGPAMVWISWSGGVFGLFFDSLLGATFERRGWLNNDMVNFLSTAGAAAFAFAVMASLR